jgi:hypothetical protein
MIHLSFLLFVAAIPQLINLWGGGQNSYPKPEKVFKWRNNGKSNMLIGIAVQPLFKDIFFMYFKPADEVLLSIKQLRLKGGSRPSLHPDMSVRLKY